MAELIASRSLNVSKLWMGVSNGMLLLKIVIVSNHPTGGVVFYIDNATVITLR